MSEAPWWLLALLAGLLALSALFSSGETALFSLSESERKRVTPRLRELLSKPRDLLVSILLCNLVVNVLFFAFATRLHAGSEGWRALLLGLGSLVAVLVCGEILPKTLALRERLGVARWTSWPISVAVFVLRPLARPLLAFLDLVGRRALRELRAERGITSELLAKVMERGAKDGALLDVEADLLAEVIELGDIRVREIMTPRVDASFLDLSGVDRDAVVARALEERHAWLPVVDGDPDHVVGRVHVRDLLRKRDRPVRQLVMPVKFVPEVASALDLLRALREDRTSEAVVVDEWGGTAGFVTAEDVFEEIVGELRTEGEERVPTVVPLGEGRFRVPGSLSIRDWNEAFGQSIVPTEFETVGGFVTALLGRIPRTGDRVRVGELELEVHSVRGRRVLTVDIGLASPQAPGDVPT